MGETHVPASTASANHHHGASETAIYVVAGTRSSSSWTWTGTPGGDPDRDRAGRLRFVPPFVPHREENPDPDDEAIVVIARTTQEAIVVNLDGLDWSQADPSVPGQAGPSDC